MVTRSRGNRCSRRQQGGRRIARHVRAPARRHRARSESARRRRPQRIPANRGPLTSAGDLLQRSRLRARDPGASRQSACRLSYEALFRAGVAANDSSSVVFEGDRVKNDNVVLIVDDNLEAISELRTHFIDAGLTVETAGESLAAIEKLRTNRYPAIVLDPMIRHRLNGYAVLHYIELEQPEMLSQVFLLTAMSRQTITRTAPALIPRFFRRPREVELAAAAVIASIERQSIRERPKRSVLLVEDDSQTARHTADALEQLGYSCQWLPGGCKVLETVTASRFDAIMLDLIMPDVDGFAVLESLRSRKPELLRRVVVTTGMPAKYLDSIDRKRICGIVQKPVDFGELRHLLHRCADVVPFEAGGESPVAG